MSRSLARKDCRPARPPRTPRPGPPGGRRGTMASDHKSLLIDQLRESGLLKPAQLDELARLPEAGEADPRALGRQVLQRGWLTRYQVNQVAHGRAKGLRIGPYLL